MRREISSDPAEILKAKDLDVVPYALRITALAERLDQDFSTTIAALNSIPLCQPRTHHPAVRRAIAEMIAARTEPMKAALPAMVATRLAPLTKPGSVEMMTQVILPLVGDMISGLVDTPLQFSPGDSISRVFSQSIGVAKRRRMEADLATLTANLHRAFPAASADTIGLKRSLAILGHDALTGTLGCSLQTVLATAAGQAFSTMDWPDLPPRTGVPYIDRVALCDVKVGDTDVSAGEAVRAHLAEYENADDARARLSFFGAGAHLCLGRALSLDLWRAMTLALQACPMVPRIEAFVLRRDDVFHIPETFLLEISRP